MAKEENKKKKMGCGTIVLLIIGVVALISAISNYISQKPTPPTPQPVVSQQAKTTPEEKPAKEAPKLTPEKLLALAKKSLAKKPEEFTEDLLVQSQLKAIPPEAPEYKEAQKLLKKMKKKDERAQAARHKKYKKKQAKAKKDPLAGLNQGEEAGLRLLAMQSKGLVNLSIGSPSTFLLVEPLAWKGLRHREKEKLARLALSFCRGLNQKGKDILFVIIWDMTTHETLGRAYVKQGMIEIYK